MPVMIMRGPPGSGKSHGAKALLEEWRKVEGQHGVILSADQYHIDGAGVYKYDSANDGAAHQLCFERFITRLEVEARAKNLIIIDNTNIRLWECAPYVLAAGTFHHKVKLIHYSPISWEDAIACSERNTHGVPLGLSLNMYTNFQPALPFWDEEVIEVWL